MRELNATACAALYERVEWSGPWIMVTLVVLAIVNVMVVLGNVLVILAVYHTSKLRNVTNMFIVSLAVADLMVGLAVLPFSATWEVYKVGRRFSFLYIYSRADLRLLFCKLQGLLAVEILNGGNTLFLVLSMGPVSHRERPLSKERN